MNSTPSDHFDGRRFHNLSGRSARGFLQLIKWLRSRQRAPWPKAIENPPFPPPAEPPPAGWTITFVNHSTFLLCSPTYTVLTDPIFSERASPVQFIGPQRVRKPGLQLEQLAKIDLVLLSHNHYDHMDLPALKFLAQRDRPVVITTLGNGDLLKRRAGIVDVRELDWWDAVEVKSDLTVTSVPAEHFSGRSLADRDRTLWAGFYLQSPRSRILFAGDTAYGKHFAAIRNRLRPPDLALLPIGAYRPQWFMGPVHMEPKDAVRAHLDLGAQRSLGMHFGTFALTDEGPDEPVEELARCVEAQALRANEFGVLGFGESWLLQPSDSEMDPHNQRP